MSKFINGLNDAFRPTAKMMCPTMVEQATEKARLQEWHCQFCMAVRGGVYLEQLAARELKMKARRVRRRTNQNWKREGREGTTATGGEGTGNRSEGPNLW